MLNLLSEQEKKLIRKEYSRRRAIVVLTFVSVLLCTALILSGFIYGLLSVKKRAITTEHENVLAAYSERLLVPVGEIGQAKKLLSLVASDTEGTSSSFIIQSVISARPAGIKISSFALALGDKPSLEVRGVAATREDLRGFGDALEQGGIFGDVLIPVSSFAKDKDIPFVVGLSIKQKKS